MSASRTYAEIANGVSGVVKNGISTVEIEKIDPVKTGVTKTLTVEAVKQTGKTETQAIEAVKKVDTEQKDLTIKENKTGQKEVETRSATVTEGKTKDVGTQTDEVYKASNFTKRKEKVVLKEKLPYVSVYLAGNSHLTDKRRLTEILRYDLHPNVVLENLSIPGGKMDDRFKDSISKIVQNEFRYPTGRDTYVIVLLGDNDLRAKKDPEKLARDIIDVLKAASVQAPNLRFILTGCVPTASVRVKVIKSYNKALSTLCNNLWESSGFYYLSFEGIRDAHYGSPVFIHQDGVHLSQYGGTLTAAAILQLVNPLIHGQFACDPPALVREFAGRNALNRELRSIRESRRNFHDPRGAFRGSEVKYLLPHMLKYIVLPGWGVERENTKFLPDVPFSFVSFRIVRHSQADNKKLAENTLVKDNYGNPLCLCKGIIDCYPCLMKQNSK